MRRIIHELLEPTIARAHEDRDHVNRVEKVLNNQQGRVQELEVALFQTNNAKSQFDLIYEKMAEMVSEIYFNSQQSERKQEETKIWQTLKNQETVQEQIHFKLDSTMKTFLTLQEQCDLVLDEQKKYQDNVINYKEEMREKLDRVNSELNDCVDQIRKEVSSQTTTVAKLNKKTSEHDAKIQKVEGLTDAVQGILDKHREMIDELDVNKLNSSVFNENVEQLRDDVLANSYKLNDFNNQVQTAENYLEKYQPIRIQNMISDTLHMILGHRERKKLAEFEKKAMEKVHLAALSDEGIPNLAEHIERMKHELMERQEAGTNHSTRKMKTSNPNYNNKGSTVSFQNPQHSIDGNSPHIKGKAQTVSSKKFDEDKSNSIANEYSTLKNPHASQANLQDQESDQELNSSDVPQINYAALFEEKLKEIEQSLNQTPYRMSQLEERVETLISNFEQKYQQENREVNEYVATMHSEFDLLLKKRKNEKQRNRATLNDLKDQLEEIRNLQEFCHISQQIELALEDKNNTASLAQMPTQGTKIFTKSNDLRKTFDEVHDNLTNETSLEKQKPLILHYRSNQFDKIELISIKNALLKKCMDVIISLPPFKEFGNLPKKCFEDQFSSNSLKMNNSMNQAQPILQTGGGNQAAAETHDNSVFAPQTQSYMTQNSVGAGNLLDSSSLFVPVTVPINQNPKSHAHNGLKPISYNVSRQNSPKRAYPGSLNTSMQLSHKKQPQGSVNRSALGGESYILAPTAVTQAHTGIGGTTTGRLGSSTNQSIFGPSANLMLMSGGRENSTLNSQQTDYDMPRLMKPVISDNKKLIIVGDRKKALSQATSPVIQRSRVSDLPKVNAVGRRFFNYFNRFRTSGQIDELLNREDCTLDLILEENDLVTELQFNNYKLQNFFDHEKLLKLVEYITEMPTEEDDEKRKFKFPFMSCEVFNSENSNILDKFVNPYIPGQESNNADEDESKDAYDDEDEDGVYEIKDTPEQNFDFEEEDKKDEEEEDDKADEEGEEKSDKNKDQIQESENPSEAKDEVKSEEVKAEAEPESEDKPEIAEPVEPVESTDSDNKDENTQDHSESNQEGELETSDAKVVESDKTQSFPEVQVESVEDSTEASTMQETQEAPKFILLDKAFEFLNSPDAANPILSGYFKKLLLALFKHKTRSIYTYIYQRPEIVERLCHNINSKSLSEVLSKVLQVNQDSVDDEGVATVDFTAAKNSAILSLVQIIAKPVTGRDDLDEDDIYDAKLNACDVLEEVFQSQPLTFQEIAQDDKVISSIKEAIQTGNPDDKLSQQFALKVLTIYATFLNDNLSPKKKTESYSFNGLNLGIDDDDQKDDENVNVADLMNQYKPSLEKIQEILPLIKEVIESEPENSNDEIETTYGKNIIKLGATRMNAVLCLGAIIKLNTSDICNAIIELNVFQRLFDLMKKYQFNNILHVKVQQIVTFATKESNQQVEFCKNILQSTNLTEMLYKLTEEGNEFYEFSSGRQIRHGTMAFVTKFGNLFRDLLNNVPEVSKILEDDSNWQLFECGALSTQNAIEAQDLSQGNTQDKEEESEADKFFEDLVNNNEEDDEEEECNVINEDLRQTISDFKQATNYSNDQDGEEEEEHNFKHFHRMGTKVMNGEDDYVGDYEEVYGDEESSDSYDNSFWHRDNSMTVDGKDINDLLSEYN